MAITVYSAPTVLRQAQWSLRTEDTVSRPAGAYSLDVGGLDFGGERWRLTIVTPIMSYEDAGQVLSWCDQLREPDAVAELPSPPGAYRIGTCNFNVIYAAASANAMTRSLSVGGIGAGKTIRAGTLISVAGQLHRVLLDVTGDAAMLRLKPRLRKPVELNEPISTSFQNVVGRFRLMNNPALDIDAGGGSQSGIAPRPITLEFVEHF